VVTQLSLVLATEPSSKAVSIHNHGFLGILYCFINSLSPAEKQPGKSGTTTPQAVLMPASIAIGYFILSPQSILLV
jgi:hypothetical protein